MKKRAVLRILGLFLVFVFFSCDLGGDSTSLDSDEAKTLYLAASEALYDEVDPLGENSDKGFLSKAPVTENILHNLPSVSANGVTMSGTVTGTITTEMPTSFPPETPGPFKNSIDITMNIEGTMDEVDVPDPNNSSNTYTVSGSIVHYMHMVMDMTMTMDAESYAITPDGTLDLDIKHTSTLTVVKSDGTKATFKLNFEDKPATIDLGILGPGSQMPNGANSYQKTAKLYTYDENGKLMTEADVSIMDVPWMMGNLMGGGAPQGGGEAPPPPPPGP